MARIKIRHYKIDRADGSTIEIRNGLVYQSLFYQTRRQETGLSLSYGIVKAHGVELRVETKEGEGTVFIIKIPVV